MTLGKRIIENRGKGDIRVREQNRERTDKEYPSERKRK